MRRSFGRPKEKLPTTKQCSCGAGSKLIKRRNFPHGRNSPGVCYWAYLCSGCNKRTIISK